MVNEPRKIFYGKPFRESNSFILAHDWIKAIELLEELAMSPNSNIANKARQNLSVAREAASYQELTGGQ